jgi:hypothetical protein
MSSCSGKGFRRGKDQPNDQRKEIHIARYKTFWKKENFLC